MTNRENTDGWSYDNVSGDEIVIKDRNENIWGRATRVSGESLGRPEVNGHLWRIVTEDGSPIEHSSDEHFRHATSEEEARDRLMTYVGKRSQAVLTAANTIGYAITQFGIELPVKALLAASQRLEDQGLLAR